MKKLALVLIYLTFIVNSFAEKIVLNLDDAVETAKSKEKQIKQAEVNLENYKLQKDEAFKTALPSLGYSGTYGLYEEEYYDSNEINQYQLTVTQPIFNGFTILTAIENADKYVDLGELSLENTKNQVALGVTQTYVNIQKLNRQLKILQNSKKVLEENQTRISRLYELGMVAKTELLDITQSVIEVDTNIIQLENSIEINLISLKNSLGIDLNQEIELNDIENLEIDVLAIDSARDINEAKESNIAMQMQKITTDLIQASEVSERAEFMPTVSMSASYGNQSYVYGDIAEAFESDNLSWGIGVSISGTLFSWGKTMDAYNQAKNDTRNAEYDEKIAEESVEIAIKSSYLELIRLEKLKEARTKALESSKENFKLQQKSYENQLVTSTDFLSAENSLRQAEISLMETELDLFYAYQNYLTLIK